MNTDTIAAIATAASNSGIGIIRVSGGEAISVVHKIYQNKDKIQSLNRYASHTIHYGFILDEAGDVIDEVMVSVMKAPHSYTAENTVEINCHGGSLVMRKILKAALWAGARAAEPGEFTKRAFLNGRIDLSQAEAVMDLIQAKNEFALKNSVGQLRGKVFKKIKSLRQKILYEIAFIESALDDPEHISLDGYSETLSEKTKEIKKELFALLSSAEDGRLLQEGIRTVILGKPNVGKSSLLNLFLGEERAIVTDVEGTTRDTLEETVNLGELTLRLTDTAGIRKTADAVEQIGVERAKKSAEEADLILCVLDSSAEPDGNDEAILSMIRGKKAIFLLNKSDLAEKVDEEKAAAFVRKITEEPFPCIVRISAKSGEGLDILTDMVKEQFFHGKITYNDEVHITSLRHREAIEEALQSMAQVERSLSDNMPEDFYSIDLMSAYAALGRVIGEEVGEDLIDEIFSKFCMGK